MSRRTLITGVVILVVAALIGGGLTFAVAGTTGSSDRAVPELSALPPAAKVNPPGLAVSIPSLAVAPVAPSTGGGTAPAPQPSTGGGGSGVQVGGL